MGFHAFCLHIGSNSMMNHKLLTDKLIHFETSTPASSRLALRKLNVFCAVSMCVGFSHQLAVSSFLVKSFWPQYLGVSKKSSWVEDHSCPERKPSWMYMDLKTQQKKIINMKHIWLLLKRDLSVAAGVSMSYQFLYNVMLVNWIIMVFICMYVHNHACVYTNLESPL